MGGKPRKKPGRVVWVSRDTGTLPLCVWSSAPEPSDGVFRRGDFIARECFTEWRKTFGDRCTPKPGQCIKVRLVGYREEP
jgi:hypothetical protein